jgi:Flp pilus assembly protein TadG
MNARNILKLPQARRGAAVLELAIVLPLFLLITFGIFEFGRAMMVTQFLTNGAREGARKAVVAGSTQAAVYQTIDNYLTQSRISGYTRTVSPNPATAARGAAITVVTSVPFSSVSWGFSSFLQNKTLTATVTMRKE